MPDITKIEKMLARALTSSRGILRQVLVVPVTTRRLAGASNSANRQARMRNVERAVILASQLHADGSLLVAWRAASLNQAPNTSLGAGLPETGFGGDSSFNNFVFGSGNAKSASDLLGSLAGFLPGTSSGSIGNNENQFGLGTDFGDGSQTGIGGDIGTLLGSLSGLVGSGLHQGSKLQGGGGQQADDGGDTDSGTVVPESSTGSTPDSGTTDASTTVTASGDGGVSTAIPIDGGLTPDGGTAVPETPTSPDNADAQNAAVAACAVIAGVAGEVAVLAAVPEITTTGGLVAAVAGTVASAYTTAAGLIGLGVIHKMPNPEGDDGSVDTSHLTGVLGVGPRSFSLSGEQTADGSSGWLSATPAPDDAGGGVDRNTGRSQVTAEISLSSSSDHEDGWITVTGIPALTQHE